MRTEGAEVIARWDLTTRRYRSLRSRADDWGRLGLLWDTAAKAGVLLPFGRHGNTMTAEKIDCGWLRTQVIKALTALAAPASEQIRYVKAGRFDHDELALGLDDVVSAFVGNCAPPKAVTIVLRALDQQLDRMSGADKADLWTDDALIGSREWSVVRGYARDALIRLGETPPEPISPNIAPMSKVEMRLYELLLRHTVEVGNGWGQTPTPLQGFFVLNRLVPNLEDPDFNQAALDDPQLGEPLSSEIMKALKDRLSGNRIDFVRSWLPLVDLESSHTISVKDGRGVIALGKPHDPNDRLVVGVFFYAGGRWSRTNRYEVAERDGQWDILKFETVVIS